MASKKPDSDSVKAYWDGQRKLPGNAVRVAPRSGPAPAPARLYGFVCLECHSVFAPHDYESSASGRTAAVIIGALTIGLAAYIATKGEYGEKLGPALCVLVPGFVIAGCFALYRPRVDYDCRSCGAGRVIPASTPRGAEIMSKNNGSTE